MSVWTSPSRSGLLLAALSACRAAGGEAPDAGEEQAARDRLSGWTRTELRARASDGEHDADLYQTLYADLGDPAADAVTAHVMGLLAGDLDGTPSDAGGEFAFGSLADSFDSALSGRLFHAYAELHDLPQVESLKLGRQLLYETPETAWFDGVAAESRELGDMRLVLGGYGGRQAIPYESSGAGDALGGIYAEARPWMGGRVRADFMHAAEETELGAPDDDLVAGGIWQQIDPRLQAEAHYSRLSGRSRDVRVGGRWYDAASDLGLSASYYRLLEPQQHLAVPLDPFFSTLAALEPYFEIRAAVAKGFGEWLHLDAGVDRRRVAELEDIGQFNRDFRRQYATAVLPELLPLDVELTLTGDRFHSEGSDIDAVSADLSKELDGGWRTELGTHYSLYEYDAFAGIEREDVRTVFLRLREDQSLPRALDVRYEYERADGEDYHQLRVGVTWRF